MRSDYSLYGVAIICFVITIIAGAFTANMISGYTLEYTTGIAAMLIFLLIGIILAYAGYSSRPKAAMPTIQPRPTPVIQPRETLTKPIAEETPPPPPAPIQTPQEEVKPEPPPLAQPEPSPPTEPVSMEAEQPVVAEEEKAKPARRRRKKASA
jgi:hypothetical protein